MVKDSFVVPDRECGTCTSCCRDLAIIEDGMKKLPGVNCEHCDMAAGLCRIYESRPNVCRTFDCAWRSLPYMDESWRPDRSGVLMTLEHNEEPDGSMQSKVTLIVVGDQAVLATDRFASMVAGFIESGTSTCLVLQGAPGTFGYSYILDEQLARPIAERNLGAVKAVIRDVYALLKVQPNIPVTAEMMGYAPDQAVPVTSSLR
jgi:hypothetical protein